MRHAYSITIQVTVTDTAELYDAAVARYAVENPSSPDCGDLLGSREEPNVEACLTMLADPGLSWPGTEIEESSAEFLLDEDDDPFGESARPAWMDVR